MGEDGELFDVAPHRSLVGAAEPATIGLRRLGSVAGTSADSVAGGIGVGLPDECRGGCDDAADEEGGHVRLLPDGELLVEHNRDLGVEVHC